MIKPGRPSGVSSAVASVSMEASQGGMVADLPKPFASRADSIAHFLFTEVTSILATRAVNVSQYVSSIGTPFTFISIVNFPVDSLDSKLEALLVQTLQ
jgi:hypothetical protein